MKKYNKLVIGSLLTALILATPALGYAKDNNEDNKGNKNEDRKEMSFEVKSDNKDNKKDNENEKGNNSWFKNASDWFHKNKVSVENDNVKNLMPSISGITSPTVLKIGEVGTWKVNASDPQNTALTYSVDWGDVENTTKMAALSETVFVQTGTFTHSYANDGKYTVTFVVSNAAGQKTTSTVTVRVSKLQNVVIAPVISNLSTTSVKANKASIIWTTDTRSNSFVWFGTTSPVNTTVNPNISRRNHVLNHKFEIKNLAPNTTYYVIVGSANRTDLTKSAEISFTTPAVVVTDNSPVISSVTGLKTLVAGTTETVTINASDPQNKALKYSVNWGDSNIAMRFLNAITEPIFIQTATLSHVYNTPGVYTATFIVENSDGKKATSTMNITVTAVPVVDTIAPVISSTEININADKTVTISWNTNELATSNIFYSTISPLDINASTTKLITDASLATKHSLMIPGLTSSTLYHFILKSADALNNVAISSEAAFTTN